MSKNNRKGQTLPLSVSQNFLTSTTTIRRMLRKTSISRQDHVIEIGPGKGHITRELMKISRQVSAYELDHSLFSRLQTTIGQAENLRLHSMDFLKAHLPSCEPYKIFANIPFSITTDIVRKLAETANPPTDAWLIMEKGAAKRFIGQPTDNRMSLLLKPIYEMKIIDHLSPYDFHPAPSVNAVLLHMHYKENPDLSSNERLQFAAFIEKCQKYGIHKFLSKKQIRTALRQAKLQDIGQSYTMLYVQWLCLFRCYCRFCSKK